MPPKVQRCSICGTLETTKWYMLDRRSICSDCHDIQLNPPLEPGEERSPERSVLEHRPQDCDDLMEENATLAPMAVSAVHSPEHRLLECPVTPKKVDAPKHNVEGNVDLESGADFGCIDEQEDMHDNITPLGMFSPRRLRHRVCPVRVPARRGTKKNGRTTKSRRTLAKKLPTKAPRETASTRTVSKLLHENVWYQLGDVVSMVDTKDNTYYAQIRGLLVDAFNEKSAVVTWLLPSTVSPPPNEGFDPATYMAGPDEEAPRRLTYMSFVMNAPLNYFLDRNDPYPRPECYGPGNTTQGDNRNYVWTSIRRS